MTRTIPPWEQLACDNCGQIHQATRTSGLQLNDDAQLLCESCQMYSRGESAGLSNNLWRAALLDLIAVISRDGGHALGAAGVDDADPTALVAFATQMFFAQLNATGDTDG